MRQSSKNERRTSALWYVLSSLVPYTEANLNLAFRPAKFFADLERISRKQKQTIRNTYYKAQKDGFITIDDNGIPRLTDRGFKRINPYKPRYFGGYARLIVIFDIPEHERWKRDRLRTLLRELRFKQVQKSVWESKFDSREYLAAEIKQLNLGKCVNIYEAQQLAA